MHIVLASINAVQLYKVYSGGFKVVRDGSTQLHAMCVGDDGSDVELQFS